MAHCGSNYYEKEVIRERPCDSYSEYSRVDGGYGRPSYPIGHRHHNNVVSDVVYESSSIPSYGHHHHHGGAHNNVVTEVVYESSAIPSYGHHHHHGGAEIIERKEERIVYENEYDPYRRVCVPNITLFNCCFKLVPCYLFSHPISPVVIMFFLVCRCAKTVQQISSCLQQLTAINQI